MRLDLGLLIRRTLSKSQRLLYAYQRDRLPAYDNNHEKSFDSETDGPRMDSLNTSPLSQS